MLCLFEVTPRVHPADPKRRASSSEKKWKDWKENHPCISDLVRATPTTFNFFCCSSLILPLAVWQAFWFCVAPTLSTLRWIQRHLRRHFRPMMLLESLPPLKGNTNKVVHSCFPAVPSSGATCWKWLVWDTVFGTIILKAGWTTRRCRMESWS